MAGSPSVLTGGADVSCVLDRASSSFAKRSSAAAKSASWGWGGSAVESYKSARVLASALPEDQTRREVRLITYRWFQPSLVFYSRRQVKQVFIEDDTLFGHKQRAVRLLRKIQGAGVDILDVNGVNVIHLFRNDRPDREVLEALIEAGFREIVLPFESGSQRIIRKYATNKWDLKRNNVDELVRVCKEYGLVIAGNYMLGYPDEILEEIEQTIAMAARHRAAGLDSANFFLVMPLPGTPLFESALREGHLPEDFDPDRMNWTKATMVNTPVAPSVLEEVRERAWRELNDTAYVEYKRGMVVG